MSFQGPCWVMSLRGRLSCVRFAPRCAVLNMPTYFEERSTYADTVWALKQNEAKMGELGEPVGPVHMAYIDVYVAA